MVVCKAVAVFVAWRIPTPERDHCCEAFVECAEVQAGLGYLFVFDVFNQQPWYAGVDRVILGVDCSWLVLGSREKIWGRGGDSVFEGIRVSEIFERASANVTPR